MPGLSSISSPRLRWRDLLPRRGKFGQQRRDPVQRLASLSVHQSRKQAGSLVKGVGGIAARELVAVCPPVLKLGHHAQTPAQYLDLLRRPRQCSDRALPLG